MNTDDSQGKATNAAPALYIVVPCYNEEAVVEATNSALMSLLDEMAQRGEVSAESKVTYVDDGSTDATWAILRRLSTSSAKLGGVKFAVNRGHQNALIAGLEASYRKGADVTVTIDADLQHDISVIPEMVRKYSEEHCEIVYGIKRSRNVDSWLKRASAQLYYKMLRAMGVKIVYNHADFTLMGRKSVAQLLSYSERNLFLRGLIPMLGYRAGSVYYDVKPRFAGESKYTFGKMINLAVDGITSLTTVPLRMLLVAGAAFLLVAFCMMIYVLYSFFAGNVVPGWSSLILSVWLIGGSLLIGLGIVGMYLGKVYLEVKRRPRYDIEEEF